MIAWVRRLFGATGDRELVRVRVIAPGNDPRMDRVTLVQTADGRRLWVNGWRGNEDEVISVWSDQLREPW